MTEAVVKSTRSASRGKALRVALLLAPPLAFLCLFFAIPVSKMLVLAFQDHATGQLTLQNFVTLVEQPLYGKVLINTVVVSFIVVAVSLVLSYPLAYVLARASRGVAAILMLFVLFPFWVSALVRTFAWTVILQREGPFNQLLATLGLTDTPLALAQSRFALVLGLTQILMPFAVLPLANAIRGIDWNLVRAAESLGAGRILIFFRVILPLSSNGIAAACFIVFILSMGAFIMPVLLGGRGDTFLAQLIEMQANALLNWNLASALSVTLLVIILGLMALFRTLFGSAAMVRP